MADPYDRLVYEKVSFVEQTHKGIRMRIRDADGQESTRWFPKSVTDWDEHEVVVPRWFAVEKELGVAVRAYSQHDAMIAGEMTPEVRPDG